MDARTDIRTDKPGTICSPFGKKNHKLLNKRFDIDTVICPRAVVLAQGRRPRANTTARGQIIEPISNLLFNDNFIT